jgi:chromosome segregation ATPase
LQKTIYTLIKESEQGKAKLHEEVARLDKQLVEIRRNLHAKIEALHEDKDATLLQLQESQASSRNFESVIEVQNEKISYLQQNNDELQKIIWTLTKESEQGKAKLQEDLKDMTNKNIAWLENQLVEMRRTLHAKIAALHQEKDAILLELHASQASVKNSKSVVEKQNEKISSLQQDKDELEKTIYTLTHKLDQDKTKFQEEVSRLDKQLVEVRRSLHTKITTLHEEKDAALLNLHESQASVRNFESMVEEQKVRIMSLQ